MYVKSPFIGVPASAAFLYLCSGVFGEILFANDKSLVRRALGLIVFVLAIAFLGTSMILLGVFTEILSLTSLIALGFAVCSIPLFRKRMGSVGPTEESERRQGAPRESYLLTLPFLASVAIAIYALLLARTGYGVKSVWNYIPAQFLPVFFLSSLSLVIVLFFTRIHVELKLALICMYSFLSHSVSYWCGTLAGMAIRGHIWAMKCLLTRLERFMLSIGCIRSAS
jgi:hypothetical protein